MQQLLPAIDSADLLVPSHDLAQDGYAIRALERMLQDCEEQPMWRDYSDLCCAYYDGRQLTQEQIEFARRNKLEPRSTNLIGRVINGVLGQEAKSRRDPSISPDDDEFADVSDVLNVRLKEAQRETHADMAISNGYGSQVKAGIGWVEVARSADPFNYQYRVQDVHRSEIWWDWRAKKIDLSDARWLVRRQWKDLDEVVATMPEFRHVLEASVNNWAVWLIDDAFDERQLNRYYEMDRGFRVNRSEWIDGGRRRVRMYEVWYKVPAQVVVMRVGHRKVILDEQNPQHVEAVRRGLVKLERAVTLQVRCAIYAGPYRLFDRATTRRRYPYIPFIAFRNDGDNTPYGLIHGMIAPQDEYNECRLRIQWMRKAQQLLIDDDALSPDFNNINDIVENMNRPDMVAVLNPSRKNADGIKFRNDFSLQKEQFEAMQDSKMLIQDVPGVYSTQLGNAPSGVTANSAMQTLVEQGIVAMGELNDNYGHARRLVYDEMVQLIAEDHAERDMQVTLGSGQSKRVVVLNSVDPQTRRPVNVVKDAPVKTGLGEVPSSPAAQAQSSQMLSDMIRALVGMPQGAMLVPAWVEQTQAFGPNRKQMADDMRKMSGLPVAGDRQGAQKWEAQQQQAVMEQQQLVKAKATADIEAVHAKTDLVQAQAAKAATDAELNVERVRDMRAQGNSPQDQQRLIAEALAEADA